MWLQTLMPSNWVSITGSKARGHAMIGKGTPLKTSIFWAYFQMKQLAITGPTILAVMSTHTIMPRTLSDKYPAH